MVRTVCTVHVRCTDVHVVYTYGNNDSYEGTRTVRRYLRSYLRTFRARVLARTLLYVFSVTSTFFCWLFSNYVEDYLKYSISGSTKIE